MKIVCILGVFILLMEEVKYFFNWRSLLDDWWLQKGPHTVHKRPGTYMQTNGGGKTAAITNIIRPEERRSILMWVKTHLNTLSCYKGVALNDKAEFWKSPILQLYIQYICLTWFFWERFWFISSELMGHPVKEDALFPQSWLRSHCPSPRQRFRLLSPGQMPQTRLKLHLSK